MAKKRLFLAHQQYEMKTLDGEWSHRSYESENFAKEILTTKVGKAAGKAGGRRELRHCRAAEEEEEETDEEAAGEEEEQE